ncbi:MAG TPA: amidohydrolase family protein [Bryobacteraceae bacterium]|jgi:L-fuconolactonase|nr:amidohydrolase family protein [Bryobacteraceae bacterium]
MPKIDAHHHFWRYDSVEYDWIDDSMRVIRRDFLPPDLKAVIDSAGVDGAISVQARQTVEETRWLLSFAEKSEFIRAVVGWAPLINPEVLDTLSQMAQNPKLRSMRHVIQSEPDPNYILREDFNRGVSALKPLGLAYDILIFERHLPQTITFVDRHPDQVFIVDHLAKPRVRDNKISPWRENLQELARRPNVYCKISGLATEADYSNWTPNQLLPYMETVLDAFGPNRTMFGSDWPVCLVAIEYQRWVDLVASAIERLTPDERERIWSGTAIEAYKLA